MIDYDILFSLLVFTIYKFLSHEYFLN